MSQDSEGNDRYSKSRNSGSRPAKPFQAGSRETGSRETGPRQDRPRRDERDGDSPRRENRSSERRDDVRNSGTDRPRFSRENDRNVGSRSTNNRFPDSDRPRFRRDDDRDNRPDRPARPDNRNDDRRSTDNPRFRRDNDRPSNDRRSEDNRPNRDRAEGTARPARFERDSESRPTFNRDEKPRFDNDRRDNRPNRNDRPERSFPRRREDGPPRSASDRNENRFDRDRPNRQSDERPRFNRDERPRGEQSRDEKPFGSPRRNDQSGRSRDDNASNFSRDRSRNDQPDKPSFKRPDDVTRETGDRPKDRFENDRRRGNEFERDSQFTGQQRKESSDRRTGEYIKAPNYNLEQTRFKDTRKYNRPDKPRRDRSESSGERQAGARQPNEPFTTRLNRYIANSGVCSRREADELIARGDISVNGKVVTEMGFKVKDGDTVKYGTKALNPERFVYVLLNKPKDYITTTDDPEERRTVMELVADAGNFRMYPVGRLDRNTTGLLLLTNDGELADKLTHPSNNIRKIYQVELDKPITEEHFESIKKGIDLEDGPIKPDALSIVTPDAQVVGIEIHSGRNRIVRRMFEKFGYEVTKLDRTTYAGLTKKELPRGKWRFLDPKEVVKLKYLN